MTVPETYRGGCLCGGVRYEADGPLRQIIGCHCTQCRKTTGHFMAATAVARDRFRLVADETLAWYRASDYAGRGFCNRCGATLFWRRDSADSISIAAGTLDDSRSLKLSVHIFTGAKGNYHTLDPALPQYEGASGLPVP